ncbi:MAG: hypothetical protein M1837_002633 [Sclerophora amabilis]|nr:MAG: hypothetical protein M1837_002633 [Sclerophora amabilis]
MASWRAEYLEALKNRDRQERADFELIQAYTRLADRTASIEASPRPTPADDGPNTPRHSQERPPSRTPPTIRPGPPDANHKKPNPAHGSTRTPDSAEDLTQIRRDLAEAQRSKTDLQTRLRTSVEELERLRARSKGDSQRIAELSVARTGLATRVRDRDEELKGKAKLLEEVQDEVISLNIELNMAEKRCKDLGAENKELVSRLMAWKGQEADAINNASRFS